MAESFGSNKPVRRRIVFYGTVQGVGFRWRARHAADRFGCTGRCSNERDGSVVMEIQGTQEQIDRVIETIGRGSFIEIERMEVAALPVEPDEYGFRTD